MPEAIKSIKKRVACPEIRKTIADLFRDVTRQRNAGISISASSHDRGSYGFRVGFYPRDPWLDSITDPMPKHPSISY